MAFDKSIQSLHYLVVDDFANVRKSIRSMLGQLGAANVHEAGNALQAKTILKDIPCDIVICDYNLGAGQDGQQLLEELRANGTVKYTTQWVMVTAETSKDMVMGAVETHPDDYLAKPFAFDTFKHRLEKWVKRLEDLYPLLTAMDHKKDDEILAACDSVATTHPRHRAWARKVQVSTLIGQNKLEEAEAVLNELLAKRPQDWAIFEKARIQMKRKEFKKAKPLLEEVLTANPNHVEAYDNLATCYLNEGQEEAAQRALMNATRVSPRNLQRQVRLGELARKHHDYNIAAKAYKEVLTLATNTRHENPGHFIRLADTLNTMASKGSEGDQRRASKSALDVARRMMDRYPEVLPVQLKGRLVMCESLDIQGMESARDGELKKVFDMSMRHVEDLKPEMAMEVAKTFYQYDKQRLGDDYVDALRRQHKDDISIQQQLFMLQSEPLSESSKQRAGELNHQGNSHYRDGDFDSALKYFGKALDHSPRHPGLILNMVQAHMKLFQADHNAKHLQSMERYLDRLLYLPPDHSQQERFQALMVRFKALKQEK
ncbi:tetratricopeptide repeat protein [Salinispirillum sp. LH 10-3-1]|uniref:Tetratricopeptide repeat protein n=1 Tax=Salinispirillum sp. LH 10-3-1 TaxID=2952525 RepID=A0AB38YD62_9GAMM